MQPKVLNPNVYPSGGFYFNEGTVRIEGDDVPDVARKLTDFRALLGTPAGDPLAEVTAFTCDRYPPACRDALTPPPSNEEDVTRKLGDRVYRWLGERGVETQTLVKRDEAQRRAEMCKTCIANKEWTGCGSCGAHAKNLSFGLRKGMEVAGSEKLNGCSEWGEDTRTSVWLNQPEPKRTGLHLICWRKP